MDKEAYVYILRCADDTLYTGYAVNIVSRLKAHNAGKGAKYTRGRLPAKLVYFEKCASKGEALRRELEIKALPREEKLALCGLAGGAIPPAEEAP